MALKLNGDNSVSTPAFTGDDADTGLQCGTNELKLVTGGSEAVTVNSTQQVGIGTTSPSSTLHVDGNARFLKQDDQNTFVCETQVDSANATLFDIRKSRGGTGGPSQITAGDVLGQFRIRGYNATGFANAFVIKSTSTINTGNFTPDTIFQNDSVTHFTLEGSTGIKCSKEIYTSTSLSQGSNGFRFRTSLGHQVARDTGAGNNVLQVLGSNGVFNVKGDGDCVNTNGRYGQISDSKLKENIVDANSQWDDIKAVRVRNYNFKAETNFPTYTQIGVVAQELETVSPGLVKDIIDEDTDGNDLGTVTKSVSYSVLYMKALKALQEAMARIETLETKVAALEAAS